MEVKSVQKQTQAGQRTRFKAYAIVGDERNYIGLGWKCHKEVQGAIKGAVTMAKLNIIPVRKGYWGNKIGGAHTVPVKVTGKSGSVKVRLVPAPRGTGLVAPPVTKKLFNFAGIHDIYTKTEGSTRTRGNFVKAAFAAIKAAYEGSHDAKDRPILDLNWDYGDPPEAGKVAREINGYYAATVTDDKGNLVAKKDDILSTFAKLTADGNTAAGCWIYTGYYAPADDGTGVSMPAAKRRGQKDPGGMGSYPYWGFAWPANRRIIYNRASADPDGNPWAEDKKLIWWDASADSGTKDAEGKPILGKWVGYDVPDFAPTKAPSAAGGKDPFIMRADGKGGLFGSLNEGPLPEHYEPLESPIANLLSKTQINPVVKVFNADAGKDIGDSVGTPDKYPIVCTTYRLTEHWQSGAMSRYLGWLSEAQPGMFVEISQELAAEKGIQNGGTVLVSSARGQIKATAMVTARWKPYTIDGKTVHQIGMPWHFSWRGIATGDSANDLTPHVGDGNTKIPEYKAFLVDLQKA